MKKIICVALLAFCCCFVSSAQKAALGTNVVQWADLGCINLEGSFAVAQHFTVNVGGRYDPWYFRRGTEDQFQNRKRGAWMGVRYWPWYTYSGWFFQLKGQWQEYNHFFPGVTEVKEEGDCFGAGLAAGYAIMINRHFNIEFGAGVWGGGKIYNEDLLPEMGRRITSRARGAFILPDDVCVTMYYVF